MFRVPIAAVCVFCWFGMSGLLPAQETPARQAVPTTYLLTNARVFDVAGGQLAESPVSILISKSRIIEIAETIDHGDRLVRIDLGGRIVLPGLIDLHSHLLLHPYDEATWNEQVLEESLELRVIRGTVAARQTLEAGFTTLRDLGTEGAGFADVALRDAIRQGMIPGPRIFTSTRALVTTGGYGPAGFDPRWKMPTGAQVADGVAGCRRATREQIAAGADWIKVYADYRRRPGDRSTPTFSQEELNAIVSEAASAGLAVAAHATTDEGIRRSVRAGVRTIEHGYDASIGSLRLMKDNGVVLCPTLTASESMALYSGWDPASGSDHPRIVAAKKLMRNALQVGVTIACGSDVGVFRHGDNVRELELMYASGMPPTDVIRSATSTAARVLRQPDLGQVKPEFLADLIVVNENPVTSISTLRRPVMVIRDGRVVVNRLAGNERDRSRTVSPPADPRLPRTDTTTSPPPETPAAGMPEPEKSAEQTATRTAGSGAIEFHVNQDGSYTHAGQPISRQELADLISQRMKLGNAAVKMIVSRKLAYEDLAGTQAWLRELNVGAVYLSFADP